MEALMGHMSDMMGPMWWWMWIPSILLIGGLIALGLWAVRRFSEPREHHESAARRILEERFARGEIDAEEFRDRMTTLGEQH